MANLANERALFEACLAQPPHERAAWLAQHCSDPHVLERIRRLLAAHEAAEARDALQTPVHRSMEERIGPYRVLERIGEGAMGEVFLAEQSSPVLRRVALKIIKPGMDSREVIARFELERQTLALMSHPSIAHIVEAGATASGRPYFAMEYVPGVPLTAYCDQRSLSVDERLALFLQVCEAVQHAHQKGVIHRDLKPSNLLVCELDGKPLVKVIDFGIAKAVSPVHAPSQAHTMLGNLIGTPEYMSPEQAQLSPLDVDTRSDVYSLGVVLHELLTGALPFATASRAATPAMLVQELLTHDPGAPSARVRGEEDAAHRRAASPRQLAARLRGDLDWIVLKALQKERNRRYNSPSEFAADIRRHLAKEPVVAGPPSVVYRMRKFVARHAVGVAAASALFISALVFGVFMAHQARETAMQRDAARYQAQRAEASSEFMSLMLEEVGPHGEPLTPVQLIDRGVDLIDKRYGGDPRFAARMLLQMSRRYMDLGSTEKQLQVLHRAEALARDLRDDELLATIGCTLVQSELEAAHYAEARQRLETALEHLARAPQSDVAARVDCLRAQADMSALARDFDRAIERLVNARTLLERAESTRGLQYNAVLTDLGGMYFRTARYREALALNLASSEALERNGRGGTFAHVTVAGNRATLLYRLGEVVKAEEIGREALERLHSLRDQAPAAPAIAINYANTLLRLDRHEEALTLLTSAHEQARALGNEYWATIAAFHLGRAYLSVARTSDAQAQFATARTNWLQQEGANRERLAELSRTLAVMELTAGRVPAAMSHIDAALRQLGHPEIKTAPGLSSALSTAALIRLKAGALDEARSFAMHALTTAEAIARDPKQSADVGEALLVLSTVQIAQGERAGAVQSIERAERCLANGLGAQHRLARAAQQLRRGSAALALASY